MSKLILDSYASQALLATNTYLSAVKAYVRAKEQNLVHLCNLYAQICTSAPTFLMWNDTKCVFMGYKLQDLVSALPSCLLLICKISPDLSIVL